MLTLSTVRQLTRADANSVRWWVAAILVVLSMVLLLAASRQGEQVEALGEVGLWRDEPASRLKLAWKETPVREHVAGGSVSTRRPSTQRMEPGEESGPTPLPPQNADGSWRGFLVPYLGEELPQVHRLAP
jgi:hypothetical protein